MKSKQQNCDSVGARVGFRIRRYLAETQDITEQEWGRCELL